MASGNTRVRVTVIVNPRSGRTGGSATAARASRILGAFWDVETVETTGPGDAGHLAREAARRGAELVMACGGDGTLSQCVSGLLGTGVPCGCIPCGTGNDFARCAGVPARPEAAAEFALRGSARPVDLLALNGNERFCLNAAGCGLDAEIASRMNRRRRVLGGTAAYLPGIVSGILSFRPVSGKLTLDTGEVAGDWTLVAFANAKSYGAGIRIAPAAEFDDGLMDVVAVSGLSRLELLRRLPLLLGGRHTGHPAVRCWKVKRAEFETTPSAPVAVDGDVVCRTPVRFEVLPSAALVWLAGKA